MSLTPETFERELQMRLGEDYRLRWSSSQHVWCIEQRVGRGTHEVPLDEADDAAIRVRDGYALCCAVHSSPIIECQECHLPVKLPVMSYGEVRCKYCEYTTGRAISYYGGYFPLSERLLQRLERTSPKRSERWRSEMNEKNARLRKEKERDWETYQDALFGDFYNRIMDRPQVGYGGSIKSTGDWTTT